MPEFHTISNIFIKIGFRNADKRQDNGVWSSMYVDERLGIRQAAIIDSVIRLFG